MASFHWRVWLLFAGCSFAPKYAKPSVQTPAAFKEMTPAQSKETDGWKTAEPKDDALRGKWWEMFHEPELNAFESQVVVPTKVLPRRSPISSPRGRW
jgi:outer membrane protein TolC